MFEPILWSVLVLGGLGAVFGVMLGVLSKKFAVKKSERIVALRENLPGANCGGCGYPGCDGLAEALAAGDEQATSCVVLSQENAQAIAEIIGVSASQSKSKVARVMCRGSEENCNNNFEYDGALDCRAAYRVGGGFKACESACLGLGTCVKVCNFDAITIDADGVVVIDEEKCTGCGACAEQCPKHSIAVVERDVIVYAACSNNGLAREVIENCSAGCIGCAKCEKACPFGAIKIENNLPIINADLCRGCGICVEQCPRKCLLKTQPNVVAKISLQTCKGCSLCAKACPFDAIEGDIKMKHKVTEACRGCGLCLETCKCNAVSMVKR